MVVTRSKRAELQQQQQKEQSQQPQQPLLLEQTGGNEMSKQDHRETQVTVVGMTYAAAVCFDSVTPNEFRGISTITLFTGAVILANAENNIEQLELYSSDVIQKNLFQDLPDTWRYR